MAKAKKSTAAAAETDQEMRENQEMAQDTQAAEQGAEDSRTARETIGPEDESELLGCEDEAEPEEAEFIEYAVTGCGQLNLRQEPSLDAPIVARLPCGIGVLGSSLPAENGWRQVFTGRLFGWVMDAFLEPLELPEQDDGVE